MTIAFILTMPGNNAWNGRWTGDGKLYCVLKKFSESRGAQILSKPSHGYNFGDGWFARVSIKRVDALEARTMRKASQGFCGYEWMIDSIIDDGTIYGPMRPKPEPVKEGVTA